MFSKEIEPIVESKLVEAGWRHTWSDDQYSTPEEVEEHNKYIETLETVREFARTHTEFDFHLDFNLNREGAVGVCDDMVLLKFPKFEEYCYHDYPYYLPVDGKGKAKRIKNKDLHIKAASVEISDKNWSPIITITVESFEIKK